MAAYRIEQGDGREVSLRSGSSQWFPISLVALPVGMMVSQRLALAHREHLGDAIRGRPYFQAQCGIQVLAVLQLTVRPGRLSLCVRVRRAKVTYSCRWKSCRGK
jgi:hypothetical protein